MGEHRVIIHDDFLLSYPELKEFSDKAEFKDIENPVDGVLYPNICTEIPGRVQEEVLLNIAQILGREPEDTLIFLRRSPWGVQVPHAAHHDLSMGNYSLMLYLNDNEEAGTAFLRHRDTGMCYAPESDDFVAIARNHQNKPDKWAIMEFAPMKQNRATIFDAGLFHCAMPIGGFGESADARTVLTCFFK
jgi:hypothetical protein